MVSVLVPIFNQPVSVLINEIHRQCAVLKIDFEIVAIEDGSERFLKENAEIRQMDCTHYIVQSENIGRAAIRNTLSSMAKYNTLIFLDCDSQIGRPDFIGQYISARHRSDVIYGGTTYTENPSHTFILHHKYGVEREARELTQRQSDPYTCFLTNNFCIRKEVFDAIKFDESLTQYGFEDSLFAWELKKQKVQVLHIDNPVVHTGLDTAEAFIDKTKLAIENAHLLLHAGKIPAGEIRMAKVYFSLKRWGLSSIFCGAIGLFEPSMLQALKGKSPKLIYLDLLKLKWMHDGAKALRQSEYIP